MMKFDLLNLQGGREICGRIQACVHVCVKSTDSIVHVLYCLSKIKQIGLFLNLCVFSKSYIVADKYVPVKSQNLA